MSIKILVLYYSRHGSVRNMAHSIAYGIEKARCEAVIRTVAPLHESTELTQEQDPFDVPDALVSLDDLTTCQALALGSPARFGNMAAPMKHFWETTSAQWLSGALIDKPAAVFTSSASMHGGNEATLLTMMLPLLHHGMLIQGLPYTEPTLNATVKGGTPYGASHVAGLNNNCELSDDEQALCIALGYRLAHITQKLNQP